MKNLFFAFALSAAALFTNSCKKADPIPKPIARFEFQILTVTANGALVSFTNNSKNATKYKWLFSDGGTDIDVSPSYIFTKNGVYTATLIADGDGGTDTFSQNININTIPVRGDAIFWSRISNKGNITVNVSGALAGTITVYRTANSAPDCGTSGFVTVSLPQGTYNYTAKSQGLSPYSWSGSISITNGVCKSLQFTE